MRQYYKVNLETQSVYDYFFSESKYKNFTTYLFENGQAISSVIGIYTQGQPYYRLAI